MKGIIDALYSVQNWIVDRSTACRYMVCTKIFTLIQTYVSNRIIKYQCEIVEKANFGSVWTQLFQGYIFCFQYGILQGPAKPPPENKWSFRTYVDWLSSFGGSKTILSWKSFEQYFFLLAIFLYIFFPPFFQQLIEKKYF